MNPTKRIGVGSHLFLTAAPDLEMGTQLSPGHWMRDMLSWILAHSQEGSVSWQPDATHVFLELTWETVRLREFPDRPSRLDCLFLWTGETEARGWHYRKHVLKASNGGLYEVEVVQCQRVFAADMNLISYVGDGASLSTLMERARRYWRGEGNDHEPEVLLEGNVVVRRNLRDLGIEALELVNEPSATLAMNSAIQWDAPGEAAWGLKSVRPGRYFLDGLITADASLPISVAGWIAVQIDGQDAPILARRGDSPVLVRPGETCVVKVGFDDLPPLPSGARYQPILICDRAAAHYWQLPSYWEGVLRGGRQSIGSPQA